jgi:hypothetical protein
LRRWRSTRVSVFSSSLPGLSKSCWSETLRGASTFGSLPIYAHCPERPFIVG